ncbi:MAG: chorismate lyase [Pseudomonadota bacterium]|nr:chorismate lyase [Pseudomonadota bacterium]
MTRLAHARWSSHIGSVHASPALRDWLHTPGSLTARLMAHSHRFRVRRIRQARGLIGTDEMAPLQLTRRVLVQQRNVVLECDDRPVIFAHTSVPLTATASDWPRFGSLGERSLGSTLFGDPRVRRGELSFARLSSRHPFVVRMVAALGSQGPGPWFARRCVFRRHNGVLLVSEIFLPSIVELALIHNAA